MGDDDPEDLEAASLAKGSCTACETATEYLPAVEEIEFALDMPAPAAALTCPSWACIDMRPRATALKLESFRINLRSAAARIEKFQSGRLFSVKPIERNLHQAGLLS
ncbi:hypothetical protein [Noviherbaspirillum malthae]|uniref:hypothetical protein n=1 Tax=Noviherbaspirillum malthae TaxID=1260987 RepID=UPI00188E9E9C|nr:hypothetical protein [Noviherbaspirillum malthae]